MPMPRAVSASVMTVTAGETDVAGVTVTVKAPSADVTGPAIAAPLRTNSPSPPAVGFVSLTAMIAAVSASV